MQLRTLPIHKTLKDKRIFMRVDFNLPMHKGKIRRGAIQRIDRVAPHIINLTKQGAKVILATHLGRPNGGENSQLSTKHLVRAISERIGQGVLFVPHHFGTDVEQEITCMKKGGVLLLENLRFDKGEEQNAARFAKGLASLADVYINNAFSVSHRKHASVSAITKYLPSYAGDLLNEEVKELQKKLPDPLVLVLGGAKIKTKIGLLNKMGDRAHAIVAGGGIGSVLYAAKTDSWENTKLLKLDNEDKKLAKSILKRFADKIHLPSDVRIKVSLQSRAVHAAPIGALPKKTVIIDIGPNTERNFRSVLSDAGSIVWNGPLGIVELPEARKGTQVVARAIAQKQDARTIAGGGDILLMLDRLNLSKDLSFISTGGGAMLALLSGENLPGLIPLKK